MLTFQTDLPNIEWLRFSGDSQFLVIKTRVSKHGVANCESLQLSSGNRCALPAVNLWQAQIEWHPRRAELYVPGDDALEIANPKGKVLDSLSNVNVDSVDGIAFSPDGDRMVVHSAFHVATYQRAKKGWQELWTVENSNQSKRQGDSFESIVASPDGRNIVLLVSHFANGWREGLSVRLVQRNMATGKVVAERPLTKNETPQGVRTRLAVTPDGTTIIGFRGRSVYAWPLDATQRARKITIAKKDVWDAALHPSGRWVVAVTNNCEAAVVDLAAQKVVRVYDWGIGPLRGVAVSSDGALAAAGSENGKVAVWDWEM